MNTPQQTAIIQRVLSNEAKTQHSHERGSLIVRARAGTGKTKTLGDVIETVGRSCSIAYGMFNKATVEEFKVKAKQRSLVCDISTRHSFGLAALKNSGFKARIEKNKVMLIANDLYGNLHRTDPIHCIVPLALRLVNYAKDRGYKLPFVNGSVSWGSLYERHMAGEDEVDTGKLFEVSEELFDASARNRDMIDFSDMIYMPLLYDCNFQKYDLVCVDEAQDTNNVGRELFKRMRKPWGGLIIVGDEFQAIYGFAGADNDSMDIFGREMNADSLPLTVCWRCSKAVIEHARRIVPDIEPAPNAVEGSVTTMKYEDLLVNAPRLNLGPETAILCRLNAPNVKMAFALIRKDIPCRIEGRDIGWSIISLIEKLHAPDLRELQKELDEYKEREMSKALAKNKEGFASLIEDKCETLQVMIDRAVERRLTLYDLRRLILEMFSDANDPKTPKDVLTLSSVHKSKGREWKRVFILGRDSFMPSKYAKQAWELQQEDNLIYVAITRAQVDLIEVTNVPER